MTFAAPVRREGEVLGAVLLASAPEALFRRLLAGAPSQLPSCEVALVACAAETDECSVVTAPNQGRVATRFLDVGERLAERLAPRTEHETAVAVGRFPLEHGGAVLAASQGVRGTAWRLVAMLDEDQALTVFHRRMLELGTAFGILASALLGMALGYLWTQRRSYTRLLALSEARETARVAELATTLDLVPAAVLMARDRECRNVVGNRAAQELLRMPSNTPISLVDRENGTKPVFQVFRNGKPIPTDWLPVVQAARAGVELRGVPSELVFADGKTVHIVGNAAPLMGEDGEPRGAVAAYLDVTEMNRKDEELQRSLSLLESTLEASDYAVLVLDLRGNVVLHNRRLADLWEIPNYVIAEGRAERIFDYLHRRTKDAEPLDALLREDARSFEGELSGEVELIRGEICEISVRPQRIQDRVIGRVWTFRDVSQRRRAEATLRIAEQQIHQSQKLDAVGRLAGGVAHDLNNVLSVVLGYSDMLLTSPRSQSITDKVRAIREAAERASRLTGQLLTFSRRQSLMPSVVDLNDVLRGMHEMLRSLMGDSVTVETYLQSDLWRIRADRGQIEQVIMNLAVNARDAMPEGGTLMIASTNVDLTEDAAQWYDVPPGRYVRMTVQDTGHGMTPEVRRKVFDPFFTTKGPGKGTGLGLATVYGVVNQTGGAVTVDSEPGKGTVFQFILPVVDAPAEAPTPKEAPATLLKGSETILLVEDDPAVRALTLEVLGEAGYRVLAASGANEAVGFARDEDGPIHLLLTDVVMPDMPGPKLAQRIRELRPKVRVVFMSGYTNGAESGIEFAADVPFLQKPFAPSALTHKVREVLEASPTFPARRP